MEDDEGFKKTGKRGKSVPTAFTLRDFMVSKSETRAKTFTRDTSARANTFSSGLVSGRSGLLAREAGDLTPSVPGGEDELLGYNMFELLGNAPEEAGGPVEKCDPLAAHHSGDQKKPSTSQEARAPTFSSSSTASSSSCSMPSCHSTYHIAPSSANTKSKEKEKNATFEEALGEHEKIMEERQEDSDMLAPSLRARFFGCIVRAPSGSTWARHEQAWTQHGQGRLAPTPCASPTKIQDKDIVYEIVEDEAVHYIKPTNTEELLQEQDGQDDQRVTGAIGVPSVELLSETLRDTQWEILKSGSVEKCSPCGMLNGKRWWEHGPTLSKHADLHHQAGTASGRDRHAEDVGRSLGLFE